MTRLEDVLKAVEQLTHNEREKVRHRIATLSKSKKSVVGTDETDWLLEGFIEECTTRGLWIRGTPVDVPKIYTENAPRVKEELLRRVKDDLTWIEKVVYGRMVAKSLIYYAGPNSPTSLKLLCNSVLHILPAIEYSFPGYSAAGLLREVIPKSRGEK